jgi:adenine-specific DNA-methyltransferase
MEFVDTEKRQNGIYYTPNKLALRLVEPLANENFPANILDPACGSGSLLSAAIEVFERVKDNHVLELYGCDIAPQTDKLSQLNPTAIWKHDFLELTLNLKFDLILTNPPYVRHHELQQRMKNLYNSRIKNICPLPKVTDLWAYFIVKSVELVNEGGTLAAILPWSFLQAEYARNLREWLASQFAYIEVTSISSQQFEDAEERIVLIWLRTKGKSAQSISIRNSPDLQTNGPIHYLSWSEWVRSRVIISHLGSIETHLSLFKKKGYVSFREIADIKIGTVTGADSFFITKEQFALDLGFEKRNLHPIIKTLKNFNSLQLNGNMSNHVLLHFSADNVTPKISEYLKKGENEKIHMRSHCIRRKPWYVMQRLKPPHAFFPYRSNHSPYLVLNNKQNLCTNSVHAINFPKLTKREMEWVQISLLSVPGQLSLEAYGKTYGSGVLKIEPNALGNAIVFIGNKDIPLDIYMNIDNLLNKNERLKAITMATEFMMSYCSINSDIVSQCFAILEELRQRRLNLK